VRFPRQDGRKRGVSIRQQPGSDDLARSPVLVGARLPDGRVGPGSDGGARDKIALYDWVLRPMTSCWYKAKSSHGAYYGLHFKLGCNVYCI
jgi:hypothetical protein